jgi:hypothetical protein
VILDGSVPLFVTKSLKSCGQCGTSNVMPACPHDILVYRTAPRQKCVQAIAIHCQEVNRS